MSAATPAVAAVAVAVATLIVGVDARANPIDAFGYGSRATAMGGAATAAPATIRPPTITTRRAWCAGTTCASTSATATRSRLLRMNGRDVGVDASRGLLIGLVAPGHIGPFRFAFGASLWLPDQRLTRVRSLPFDQPRFVHFDNRPQRLYLAANLAIQIVPGLYVGGGLTFMSRTAGQLFLKGSVAVSDPDASSLVSKIDVDLVAVRYPQAGILWEATPWLSVGASYRHTFVAESRSAVPHRRQRRQPGAAAGGRQRAFWRAHSISADLVPAVAAHRRRRVAAQAHAARHVRSDLRRVERLPRAGGEPDARARHRCVQRQGHAAAGALLSDVGVSRHRHSARRASSGARGERPKLAIDLRAGYSYEPTPVPEQIGESNFADSDKHTFSVGAGLELARITAILPRPLAIDVHFAGTYLPARANHKIDPLDPVGDFVADGVIVQIGVMLRSRF